MKVQKFIEVAPVSPTDFDINLLKIKHYNLWKR